jgi:hypothetical protein
MSHWPEPRDWRRGVIAPTGEHGNCDVRLGMRIHFPADETKRPVSGILKPDELWTMAPKRLSASICRTFYRPEDVLRGKPDRELAIAAIREPVGLPEAVGEDRDR